MGSIRKASHLLISTISTNQKCLLNVSWSMRASIRGRLLCTSAGMCPVNVKCQNIDSDRLTLAYSKTLQRHSPWKWNLHHLSRSSLSCHGSNTKSFTKNNFENVSLQGGVATRSCVAFDRDFSTNGFTCSKAPKSTTSETQINPHEKKLGPNLKDIKENIMTIPNLLTMSRILLAPALAYLVVMESYAVACGIFVFVGITDVLDGWIARSYPSQASAAGSFLDPLADKLLITVLFLSLTAVDLIPWPLTGLVLARDFLLIAAAFYIRYITLPQPRSLTKYFDATTVSAQLKPTLISKANTAVQLSLVAFSLGAPVFGYVDHIALKSLWYLTAGTTFISGLSYVFAKNTFEALRKSKDGSQS